MLKGLLVRMASIFLLVTSVSFAAAEDVNLVTEGLKLMVIGMGVVFFFLILLVLIMGVLASIVRKIDEMYPEEVKATPVRASRAGGKQNEETAAAIAAVHMYRKNK